MNQTQPTSLFFCKTEEVDSEGTVRCPQCNNVISPDDFSNMTYEILEAIMDKHNELMKVVVQCLVCKCDIVIVLKRHLESRSALHNSVF